MRSLRLVKQRLTNLFSRCSKDAASISQIAARILLEDLAAAHDEYIRLVSELEGDENQTEIDAEISEVEDLYFHAREKLIPISNSHNATASSQSPQEQDRSESVSSDASLKEFLTEQKNLIAALTLRIANNRPNSDENLKLPHIDIPKFDGTFDNWIPFKDIFNTTVNGNASLSQIQKFSYLKSLLIGEAAATIRSIPLTSDNYATAWTQLEDRYDKPFLIVRSLIQSFFTCETVSDDFFNLKGVTMNFSNAIKTLESLGPYANSKTPWILHLMTQKKNRTLKIKWADLSSSKKEPSLEEFLNFLKEKCQSVDLVDQLNNSRIPRKPSTTTTRVNNASIQKCMHCEDTHSIYKCAKFAALSVQDRSKLISSQKRCFNCLAKGHSQRECKSEHRCIHCKKNHNSLLHRADVSSIDQIKPSSLSLPNSAQSPDKSETFISCNRLDTSDPNFLPTASVLIDNWKGKGCAVRALLDTGAQSSFISSKLVKQLGLQKQYVRVSIKGPSSNSIKSTSKVSFRLKSGTDPNLSVMVVAYVLDSVIDKSPHENLSLKCMNELTNQFTLSDREFHVPKPIDLILSASITFSALKFQRFFNKSDNILVQNTVFGWVVCGVESQSSELLQLNNLITSESNEDCQHILERFWLLEEPPSAQNSLSTSDSECESLFLNSVKRLSCGRFSVGLPFRQNPSLLGSSYNQALNRLRYLEKRLSYDREFGIEYRKFMCDYESLGHMEKVSNPEAVFSGPHYVIPHHGIWQKGLSTRKLRVVFDASAKSSTGISLNQILHSGPALQINIVDVIIRFRLTEFVLSADIEKMYRQIQINEEDRKYQLVLWRSSPDAEVSVYQLNTVTYGESCAPFLALRTVNELVKREGQNYPSITRILEENKFVDDIFFGANTLDDLRELKSDLTNLLRSGGFVLKKWCSNSPELLSSFDSSDLAHSLIFSSSTDDISIKTLGIQWYPKSDVFGYNYSPVKIETLTKRTLLSQTAKIFDPLGWISPVIFRFKLMFQITWTMKLNWDDILPSELSNKFFESRQELPLLENLSIPRFLGLNIVQLHGFCDASSNGYAAVIYVKAIDSPQSCSTRIVLAKTKLAPIKQISIPRLELCAAHLLAKLIHYVRGFIKIDHSNIFLWSDSTIVLAWLSSLPRQWSTFVGNRVGEIHNLCPNIRWYHVNSSDNPADIASRGCTSSELISSHLWWNGPPFLIDRSFVPQPAIEETTVEEARKVTLFAAFESYSFWDQLISRFSSFNRLLRSLAYSLRFISIVKGTEVDRTSELSCLELHKAKALLLKNCQHLTFLDEYCRLKKNLPISSKSRILRFSPSLNDDDLIILNGRISQKSVSGRSFRPILLPNGHLSELLILKVHAETFHGGVCLVMSRIRETYWIVGLKRLTKRVISRCSRCKRFNSKPYDPSMGQLPSVRYSVCKPFSHTGIDFAGPIQLRPIKARGNLTVKGYISIFICMTSKAVHLELVMGLSTEHLILAIKRFLARRGPWFKFYSDNGKNFVGLRSEIQEFKSRIESTIPSPELRNFLTSSSIEWTFIPPYSPHFGGIWESNIKSTKHHLLKTFNGFPSTLEDFSTALCEVERILNSRPLSPLELTETEEPLTPQHLLSGHGNPVSDFELSRTSFRSIYKRQQSLISHFWQRWRKEYLDTLFGKYKWRNKGISPALGDVVIVKRSSDPPQMWHYGRVVDVFPGIDGEVRVVNVLSQGKIQRESARNLIKLNIDPDGSIGGI